MLLRKPSKHELKRPRKDRILSPVQSSGSLDYWYRDVQPVYDPMIRISQLYELLNQVGKSGYVDVGPIIKEILRLQGITEAYTGPKTS